MINNIRNAFVEMLRSSTWMDDESKEKAIRKVDWLFMLFRFVCLSSLGTFRHLLSINKSAIQNIYRVKIIQN